MVMLCSIQKNAVRSQIKDMGECIFKVDVMDIHLSMILKTSEKLHVCKNSGYHFSAKLGMRSEPP